MPTNVIYSYDVIQSGPFRMSPFLSHLFADVRGGPLFVLGRAWAILEKMIEIHVN